MNAHGIPACFRKITFSINEQGNLTIGYTYSLI